MMLLAPLLLAADVAATDPLPHSLQVDKLSNGLTVVTVPFDSPGIVAYFTLVQAGSRDEVEPGKSGYAHLFEHLMFRGTDSVPADEYLRRITAMGADDNAFTTEDMTLYTTTLPSSALSDVITLDADRFQHLHVAPDKYKDETGAVLGERNKVFANPEAQMDETMSALAFKVNTYGHTTIGNKRDVEDMPNQFEYSRQFFKRFYTPDDCVVFVVGDFDRDKALGQIKSAYGSWSGHRARVAIPKEPEQKKPQPKAIAWHGPTAPRIVVGWHVPALGDSAQSMGDAAALATLIAATFGEASDLYQRLVVKEQKVITLDSSPRDVLHKDAPLVEVSAKLHGSTSFDEVIGAAQAAVDAAARGELPAAKIEAARERLSSQLILGTQTPGEVARYLAYLTSSSGGDVHALEKWAAALAAVKPADVARVAKQLTPKHRDVVTLTSEAK